MSTTTGVSTYDVSPYGGIGGVPFNEMTPDGYKIAIINIWSGSIIDGLQLVYRNNKGDVRKGEAIGKTDNNLIYHEFVLGDSEYLISLIGMYGECPGHTGNHGLGIKQLKFVTTHKESDQFGGGLPIDSDQKFIMPGYYKNSEIRGFFGRAASIVDSLGLHVQIHEPS